MEFEEKVLKPQQLLVMEEALMATPARWCMNHKNAIT